jgi:hypothetical protein
MTFTHFWVAGEIILVESVELRHQNIFDEIQIADKKSRLLHLVDSNVSCCRIRTAGEIV